MRIGVIDTETTGVKLHRGDKIIEVSIGVYDMDGDYNFHHVTTYTQRVNPLRSIAVEAQRVHGISLEDLRDMPTWPDVADNVQSILESLDLMVMHNAGFDQPFIASEQQAAGHKMPDTQAFCTMENARWATFDGKLPKLSELCWTLGVDYDHAAAHAAEYDVQRTMECLSKGLRLGLFKLEKVKNNE